MDWQSVAWGFYPCTNNKEIKKLACVWVDSTDAQLDRNWTEKDTSSVWSVKPTASVTVPRTIHILAGRGPPLNIQRRRPPPYPHPASSQMGPLRPLVLSFAQTILKPTNHCLRLDTQLVCAWCAASLIPVGGVRLRILVQITVSWIYNSFVWCSHEDARHAPTRLLLWQRYGSE